MRADGPIADLTPEQKKIADSAGIPADRPGLGAEYPKMVYRPGENERHHHLGQPLLIAGQFECQVGYVDTAEDEAQALADGWYLSPDPAAQKAADARREAEQAKDDYIAELEAELAKKGEKQPAKAAAVA